QVLNGSDSRPGRAGPDAVLQLKSMGVEYLVMTGPRSQEYYRDFRDLQKFEGLMETVYLEGDDRIYRLPFSSLAHLVRPGELPESPPVGPGMARLLEPYVAAIEDAARPKLRAEWRGADQVHIEGPIPEGMSVSVQVSHDWGWTATQDGAPISIDRDKMGFLLLRARPAALARIDLAYRGTTDQRVMAGISGLAWMAAIAGLWFRRKPSGGVA
ncbi:MAG: hypothetical protein HY238_26025, partial [Acidobacteria bacterium]|nr:hypothetical protein [Acidobacteriota bacterium]